MNGDRKKIQLAYSLLFSLPGTQMIRYGDEIGMGDDLSLKGRSSVRTPMQWSPAKNGGFSDADDGQLVHPVIDSGAFAYSKVNVLSAQQDPQSLLNWLERLITTRKGCPEIGWGELFIVPCANPHVLIHGFRWKKRKLVFIHNLSAKDIQVLKTELGENTAMFNVFNDEEKENDGPILSLKPYGYRWYRVE